MGTQSMIGMYKPLPKNQLIKKNVFLMIAWILGVGFISNAGITFVFVRSLLLAFFQSKYHGYSLKSVVFFASPYLIWFLLICPTVLSNFLLRHFWNSVRSSCLQNQGNVAECTIFFVDVGGEMGFAELSVQHYKTIIRLSFKNNSIGTLSLYLYRLIYIINHYIINWKIHALNEASALEISAFM